MQWVSWYALFQSAKLIWLINAIDFDETDSEDRNFVNIRDDEDRNALHIAIKHGCRPDLITKLMEWYALMMS